MTTRFPILMTLAAAAALQAAPPPRPDLHRLPLSFEAAAEPGSYFVRGDGFNAHFTPARVTIAAPSGGFQMIFRGANASAAPAAEERLAGQSHYLRGDEPAWRTHVAQFGQLRYAALYPGIDAVFHGQRQALEYDFIVAAGADPARIELEFEGASMEVQADGALALARRGATLYHHRPFLYQVRDGARVEVSGRYVKTAANRVRFATGAYDRTLPLVIDPVLQYSSYLGGKTPVNNAEDIAYAIAVDADGFIYIAGRTLSQDLPTKNGFQKAIGSSGDAFVTKLDPAGKEVIWSTYLGGDGLEYAYSIQVGEHGQAHITGVTGSRNFPMKNAFQSKHGGLNIPFVTKLSKDGASLVFSTFLGGERNDLAYGLGLDRYGNVYVAGRAGSVQFPVKNAMQPKLSNSYDGFLSKFSPEGELMYSTLMGGTGNDEIYAIAVDPDGYAYVTGLFGSNGFATGNAFQTKPPLPRDAFVAKVTPDGQAFAYFTYVGGARGTDEAHAIAIDAAGNAYIGGYTASPDFPVTGDAVQPKRNGSSDAFVTKINESGSAIVWSTYLGGSKGSSLFEDEYVSSIAVDADGCVYVGGNTISPDFPNVRATQTEIGGARDGFLAKLTADGTRFAFSTFTGGAERDDVAAVALGPWRSVYTAGQTYSTDLPLVAPLSDQRGSSSDAFVTRICDPVLFLSTGALDFSFVQGSEKMSEAQTFKVAACRDLEITVTHEAGWLAAEAGKADQGLVDVKLAVNPASLEPGDYPVKVTVSAPDAFFGPVSLTVTLHVTSSEI